MTQNSVNLSVKDFQIIKSANLSFLPGLNCLIGQSNNGKSALMRAAKSCIYNEPGTTSVRLGCNNFAVGLQMNGHTVILQKGSNSLYKIDGEVYGKIGRTQLEEVAKALGIKQLNINGSNEEINFWDQMEKPFLLDRSETELFRFIVDSGKDNNVTTALKSITQDRQQITKDITLTEGKLNQIEVNLKTQEEVLKDVDKKLDACNKVIELGPKIKRVKEITDLKNKALSDGQQLSKALLVKSNLDSLFNKVNTSLELINTNTRKTTLIADLMSNINQNTKLIDELETKVSKMSTIDDSELKNMLDKYNLLTSLVSKTRSTQDLILELNNKQYPSISDDFIKKVEDFKNLSLLLNSINSKQEDINKEEDLLDNIILELEEVNKEINDIGICPTCGQPMHTN